MPMAAAAPLAAPLIMGGLSAIGGMFGQKKKSTTNTTTTPTFSAQQTNVQNAAGADILSQLENPSQAIDKLHDSAIGDVNSNYSGIEARMKRALTGTGFGNSGKVATGTQGLEIARAGELGGLESKFAGMQLGQNNSMLDLASRFGFAAPGSHTEGTTTGTEGGGVGGGIQAGLQTGSFMYALNHLLNGGD